MSDAALAPAGMASYYAFVPVPNKLVSDVDWSRKGAEFATKILQYLKRSLYARIARKCGYAKDLYTR